MIISAPYSNGLVSIGVDTVESTINLAPHDLAILAADSISIISHVGLQGVSIHIIFVCPSITQSFKASGSAAS